MRFYYILIAVLLCSGCTTQEADTKQGPNGSWWIGGDDGGAYISIEDDENTDDNIYTGTVYFDHDQTIWYQGPFKLIGNIKFSIDDHNLYLFWDGEKIHLKQSSYLEAIEPIPPL